MLAGASNWCLELGVAQSRVPVFPKPAHPASLRDGAPYSVPSQRPMGKHWAAPFVPSRRPPQRAAVGWALGGSAKTRSSDRAIPSTVRLYSGIRADEPYGKCRGRAIGSPAYRLANPCHSRMRRCYTLRPGTVAEFEERLCEATALAGKTPQMGGLL